MSAPTVRAARPEDAPFLAWAALAASRSHVERGAFDLAVEGPGDGERLAFLERLLTTERAHWCHHAGFLVAEVGGEPAAALSGYGAEDGSLLDPGEAIVACARASGWPAERLAEAFRRLSVFTACLPEDEPGAWVVEWVATRPERRRRGLVQVLLDAILERGRERGHTVSQIMILSGNVPAQRAYERAGFRYVDERRSAAFEAATGSPGLLRMLRPLQGGGSPRADPPGGGTK